MNKKIKTYLEAKGFTTEGNSAYGTIRGYDVTYTERIMDNVAPCTFIVSCVTEAAVMAKVVNELYEKKIPYARYGVGKLQFTFSINDLTIGRLLKRMDSVFDEIFGTLERNGVKGNGYCPKCGEPFTEEKETKTIFMNSGKIKLHLQCANDVDADIEKEKQAFDAAPNNYLKGFFGALIGAVAGALVAFIFTLLGIVSAISSIVGIGLGCFLYNKFGGKSNWVMIVMTVVTTFAVLFFGIYLIYIAAANGLCAEAHISFTGAKALSYCMENVDGFKSEFVSQYIYNAIFGLIGAGCIIVDMVRRHKVR